MIGDAIRSGEGGDACATDRRGEIAAFTVQAVLRQFDENPVMAFEPGSLWSFRHLEQFDRPTFLDALSRLPRRVADEIRGELRRTPQTGEQEPDDDDDEIDGAALLELDLPDAQYLCRPWIPEGVLILAGRPKIGKTTLLRQFAVSVADGAALWGATCEQAEVLFLSLEEGQKLMRKKLLAAGYRGSQVRRIVFRWKWRNGAEGVADIRARLSMNPRIRFVIVDSLTRFRDAPTREKPQFHQDYEAVRLLADVAKDHPGLTIIILHHTKKDQGDDPIADISGTFGLTAAADNYMVMRREGGEYVLHCGGRYWDEPQDAFRLRRDGGAWALEGVAAPVRLSPLQRQYLDTLRAEGTVTTRGMARRFNVKDNTASEVLAELQAKGLADRVTDGWRAVHTHTETPERGEVYE